MEWVAQVKNKCASRFVIVGEKHAARGHYVFRVMDVLGLLVCDEGGHEVPVGWRGGVGVDHREKIVALFRLVPVQANM